MATVENAKFYRRSEWSTEYGPVLMCWPSHIKPDEVRELKEVIAMQFKAIERTADRIWESAKITPEMMCD